MVGPMAGATEITIDTLPMITPRRCAGTRSRIVVINSGIMIAVPEAWMTRAASSKAKLGDAAASRVPAVNRPMASRNTVKVSCTWA